MVEVEVDAKYPTSVVALEATLEATSCNNTSGKANEAPEGINKNQHTNTKSI